MANATIAANATTAMVIPTTNLEPGVRDPVVVGRASRRAGAGVQQAHHGSTRWTGLPWMSTDHVVVSLAWLTLYSISHQPSSSVMSPGGFRPP